MRSFLFPSWVVPFLSSLAGRTIVLVLLLAGGVCGQEIIWSKTYGGFGDDGGFGGYQTSDGGYVVTGMTLSYGAGAQVYLIKTDRRGDTLWARTYGGGDGIRATPSGRPQMAAISWQAGPPHSVWQAKSI